MSSGSPSGTCWRLAAVIPAAGWIGDRFGTKRVFVISLAVFVAMSLLCGAAQSLEQLIVFRVLQGVGGGMLTPIGGAMLYRAFPVEERAKAAIGVLGVAVLAPAIGPLLGGILVDEASWRWIFYINGPIGAVAFVLSWRWLREETQPNPGRFDLAGLVLSAAGVSLLLYTLTIGPHEGWLSAKTVAFGLVGVACLIALVVIELRIDDPILALRLFRDRSFRTINIASSMTYAGFFGMIFVLPLYLQSLRGYRRVPERAGTVTAGGRHLPRVEPARPPPVPGDRAASVDGRRHRAHVGDHLLLLAGRARHAVVGHRRPVVPARARRRDGVRVDPDGGVRHHLGRRHGSCDVAVQHATTDRLRRRHRRGGDGDRRPHPVGRPGAGGRATPRVPSRIPRGRPDHGAGGGRVVVPARRRRGEARRGLAGASR